MDLDHDMSSQQSHHTVSGVLTRTVVQSPVVRQVLSARLRDNHINDAIFIGGDFIEVKTMAEDASLESVAVKNDFESRILAAAILTLPSGDSKNDDDLIKAETQDLSHDDTELPTQIIVLSTEFNELLFVGLVSDSEATVRFVYQSYPIPTFDNRIFQPGYYLAVDPYSRALALAANDRELIIYSTKAKYSSNRESSHSQPDLCPVAAQRALKIDGVIQLMDFLIPAADDKDHIVLLIIAIDQHKVKATRIDWYNSSSLQHAQVHPGLPLEIAKSLPNLLVPLENASFLLGTGTEIRHYKDILSGSIDYTGVMYGGENLAVTSYPGASAPKPAWASWCRSDPSTMDQKKYRLYLAREDGAILLMEAKDGEITGKYVGSADCHVGSAFAFLESDSEIDVLALVGDSSSGYLLTLIHSGGSVTTEIGQRNDTDNLEMVEMIPNWASVTDMIATSLPPGRTKRPRDGIFVTSGRQPFGNITELRHGLEARLSLYFELPGLQSVNEVWAFSIRSAGVVLTLLSGPSATRILSIPSNADIGNVEELDQSSTTLDVSCRTIEAAMTSDASILQVTEKGIRLVKGIGAQSDNSDTLSVAEDSTILSAHIDTERHTIATIERTGHHNPEYNLALYSFQASSRGAMDLSERVNCTSRAVLSSEPLCVRMAHGCVVVSTVHGKIEIFDCEIVTRVSHKGSQEVSLADGNQSVCDHLALLESDLNPSMLLVICGMRDGRIVTFALDLANKAKHDLNAAEQIVHLGHTSVRLKQTFAGSRSTVYAMTESDMCLVYWNGLRDSALSIQSIWITDKERPNLAQSSISTCTRINFAQEEVSPISSNSLILVSGDEFLIAELGATLSAIPRQLAVSGTPNRVIYSEQHRCFVSASLCFGVRTLPASSGGLAERRQIWPVIDFIPTRSSQVSCSFKMQPGERIYTLLEWSLRLDESKTYSFILVGGSYTRSSGKQKGRVWFLQPISKSWEVYNVNEGRSTGFEEPVYALALWDEVTYVACSGSFIYVYRFAPEDVKWRKLCKPIRISSIGIHLSISQPQIYVSTAQDSLVVLSLTPDDEDDEYQHRLQFDYAAPRAGALLNHISPDIQTPVGDGAARGNSLTIATTKYGQVIGLRETSAKAVASNETPQGGSSNIVFEAQLPRSLTRIRQSNTRPPWKQLSHNGILASNLVGCATDGSLVGITLLSDDLFRRLCWLQQLCEWSSHICPHARSSYQSPHTLEITDSRAQRAMPIGLSAGGTSEILMSSPQSRVSGRHVNGDVLARLQQRGGSAMLKSILHEVAARDDRAGEWVKEHLQEELEAVDEMMGLLGPLLECCI